MCQISCQEVHARLHPLQPTKSLNAKTTAPYMADHPASRILIRGCYFYKQQSVSSRAPRRSNNHTCIKGTWKADNKGLHKHVCLSVKKGNSSLSRYRADIPSISRRITYIHESIRGKCSDVYQSIYRETAQQVATNLTTEGIQWHFSPSSAPMKCSG